MNAYRIYNGSDGAMTRRLYKELRLRGAVGDVASSLFRAQKCSRRAKKYGPYAGRGGMSFRDMAYERKGESLKELTAALELHAERLGIVYGWGRDEGCNNPWVLYIEIPQGQVSFHSPERYSGPDYPQGWDGRRLSESRIIEFCQCVLDAAPAGAQRFEVMEEV